MGFKITNGIQQDASGNLYVMIENDVTGERKTKFLVAGEFMQLASFSLVVAKGHVYDWKEATKEAVGNFVARQCYSATCAVCRQLPE